MQTKSSTKRTSVQKGRVPKKRASVPTIRGQMLEDGAVLLRFTVCFSKDAPEEKLKISKEAEKEWRSVEQYGFLILEDGCLIPAPCKREGANKTKKNAYDVAYRYFSGQTIERDDKAFDELGWPIGEQLSHLCHDNACCCYKCLIGEETWRNRKRNYCGRDGTCDCGMDPPCKKTYRSSHVKRVYAREQLLVYSSPHLGDRVKAFYNSETLERTVKVKILPANHYRVKEKKDENKGKRVTGSKRTREETRKKDVKRGPSKKRRRVDDEESK